MSSVDIQQLLEVLLKYSTRQDAGIVARVSNLLCIDPFGGGNFGGRTGQEIGYIED